MKKINEEEIIDLAHATYGPYMQVDDELEILIKSDDGGRHIEFTVSVKHTAVYLRESVPHTFEGLRTIIRYKSYPEEE
tara:strand:+ start:58 stop:291 length:234 start_codon:yes stop_codon:yes gene_type:complete